VNPRSYDEWSKLDKEIEKEEQNPKSEVVANSKAKVNNKGKGSLKADEMVGDIIDNNMNGGL